MGEEFVMKPINSIVWVAEDKYEMVSPEDIHIGYIGEKAYGLASLPSQWTLPFFVVSGALWDKYKRTQSFGEWIRTWEDNVHAAAELCGISDQDLVIVRSNAQTEGLKERGKYISVKGHLLNWLELVKQCFDDAINHSGAINTSMPIIIQKQVIPLLCGHVSNERRVAEERRDWQGEIESTPPRVFTISLRKWRKRINVDSYLDSLLICPSDKLVKDILSIPCTWATEHRLRVHFEWIYDGDYIFLVQADEETESTGVNPLEISIETSEKTAADTIPFPRCLHRLTAEDADKYKSYSKIQNPLLYQKLGQDIAPLYILDDKSVLEQLAQGVLNQNLESDLQILVSQSLIIRTDIDTDDKEERQLLPRTCEIREMSLAVEWLEENYKKLSKNSKSNIIFILHNFIPAFSSAFAYASPQDNIVRIEALWGLPEGLYYYSHDKYIVDTIKTDISAINIEEFQIKEKRSFKKYFVFPMKDGSWDVQSLIKPYDWKSSIPQKDWVREIALVTRKIAEAECQSVNVMWFVGVDDSRYSRNVFPWFHEPYKYIEDKGTPRNKLSFERTIVIHKLKDIELLESQSISQRNIIRNILVQPTDEKILRDREVIGRIGKTAKSLGANIILEGGVLSHAYYQLIRTGAKVEARNTFSKTQSLEFNKLVRDKIPEKIERNGEEVVTTQLKKDVFISLLKRKLVEESLEVYDATEKEDMVAELADVMEVIDAIIKEERINRQNILDKKEKKREKVGGFEKGVYLKRTLSSTEMSDGKVITDHTAVDVRQKIAKSTDARKYSTANEAFTRIKVPITLDTWEIRPPSPTSSIDIVVRGRRKQNILQIEISIFEKAEQMSLFD